MIDCVSSCGTCQGLTYDVCLRASGPYPFCLIVKDVDTGDPIDLTGKMFDAYFKRAGADANNLILLTSFSGDIIVQPLGELGKIVFEVPQADIQQLLNDRVQVGIWYLTMEPGLGTTGPTQLIGGKFTVRGGN